MCSIQVALPTSQLLRGVMTKTVSVSLTGFKLRAASAVSDYWCQGTSFGNNCWLADMMPAPTGIVERASFLVMMSRFKNREMFRSLRRLWKEGDVEDEARVKRILQKATTMDEDLRAELCRTRVSAWKTQRHFRQLFAEYGLEMDIDEPAIYSPPDQHVHHTRTA